MTQDTRDAELADLAPQHLTICPSEPTGKQSDLAISNDILTGMVPPTSNAPSDSHPAFAPAVCGVARAAGGPSESEAVAATVANGANAEVATSIRIRHFAPLAPQGPWTVPPLGRRRLSRTRNNLAPTMADQHQFPTDSLFRTPNRKASSDSVTASPFHDTLSGSRKRRAIDGAILTPPIPTPSPAEYYATPNEEPATPGIFGSQARGIRSGRSQSVQIDHFYTPPQGVLAQLQEIPQILSGGMANLLHMVTDLAQQHNALERRVIELERENRALKGQASPPSPMLQSQETANVSEELQHQQWESDPVYEQGNSPPRKKRSKSDIPMAGGPYGGPLYIKPPKGPSMLGSIFSNRTPNKAGSGSPGSAPARRGSGFRPLKPLGRAAAAERGAP